MTEATLQVGLTWETLELFLKHPIAYHRIFADIGGGVVPGLFLSQSYYWTFRTDDQDGWFYKSIEEWEKETGLTRYEQETARKKLKATGVIEELKRGVPCRLHFRINRAKFLEAIATAWVGGKKGKKSKKAAESLTQSQFGENQQTSLGKSNKLDCGKPASKPDGNQQTSLMETSKQAWGKAPNILYTETTNRDYSEITPETTAHEGEEKSTVVTVEVLDQKAQDLPNSLQLPPSSTKEFNSHFGQENKDPVEDQCSAAPCDNIVRIPQDGVYPRNIDGSERLPWHTRKRRIYTPEFEQHLMRRLSSTSHYKELMMGDALTSVRKYIAKGDTDLQRRAELEIEWEYLWGEDDFNSEAPIAQVKVKDAIADFETQKAAERFKRIQQENNRKAEAARKAAEEAERVKTSEPRSEPSTGAASRPSANDYDPELTRIAREKARAEVDAMEARRQQQRRA